MKFLNARQLPVALKAGCTMVFDPMNRTVLFTHPSEGTLSCEDEDICILILCVCQNTQKQIDKKFLKALAGFIACQVGLSASDVRTDDKQHFVVELLPLHHDN